MPEKPGFVRVKPVKARTCNAVGYRLGLKIADGQDYSMKGKREVIYAEVMLPDNTPKQLQDINILCKSAEAAENKNNKTTNNSKKIRYGKELVIELDNRLSAEAKTETLRQLAAGIVDEGYAVALAIHDPKPGQKIITGDGETDKIQKTHGHIFIFPRQITIGGNSHEINNNQSKSNLRHDALAASTVQAGSKGSNDFIQDDRQASLSELRLGTLATSPSRPKSILRIDKRSKLSKRSSRRIKPDRLRWMAAAREPSLIACWNTAKSKTKYKLDENGQKIHKLDAAGNWTKDKKGGYVYIRYTEGIDSDEWRLKHEARWVQIVNDALAREGKPDETISMAQYSKKAGEWRLGQHDRKTQRHMGQKATALEKKGIRTDVGDFNRTVHAYNILAAALANRQNELTEAESAFAASKQADRAAETPATTNLDYLAPTIIDHGYYIDRNIDYSDFINIGNESNDSDSNYDFGGIVNENQLVLGPMPPTGTGPQAENVLIVTTPDPVPASVAAETAPTAEVDFASAIEPPKQEKPAEVETMPATEPPKPAEPDQAPTAAENVPAETIFVPKKEPISTTSQEKPIVKPQEKPIEPPKPAADTIPVDIIEQEKPIESRFDGVFNDGVSAYNHYICGDKHFLAHIRRDGSEDPRVAATQERISKMQEGPLPQAKTESPVPVQVKPAPPPPPASVIEPPKPTPDPPIKPAEPHKSTGIQVPIGPKKSLVEPSKPLQKSPAGDNVTKKPQPAPTKPQTPTTPSKHSKIAASAAIYDNGISKFLVLQPAEAAERKRYAPYVAPISQKPDGTCIIGKLMDLAKAEIALSSAKQGAESYLPPINWHPHDGGQEREEEWQEIINDRKALHQFQVMMYEIAADNARQALAAARHIEGRDLGPGM